jgi:hypothetical protein
MMNEQRDDRGDSILYRYWHREPPMEPSGRVPPPPMRLEDMMLSDKPRSWPDTLPPPDGCQPRKSS